MRKITLKKIACLLFLTGITISTFSQSWEIVGNAGFSMGNSTHLSFAISDNNEPCVAFRYSTKTTVMKFDGSDWGYVGSQWGISEGVVEFNSLAFSNTGEPYVAFYDWANQGITVRGYDGTEYWAVVGTQGFSPADSPWYTSLAFSNTGEPYVAYSDATGGASNASFDISVMKFDGTDWVMVGNEGFSSGYDLSLVFSPDGTPYISFRTKGLSNRATVMKFDGTDWVLVGNQGFSAGSAFHMSMAFNSIGEPYVAYQDGGNSYKTTVMKFNGTAWENTGSAGFSAGIIGSTSIAFNNNDEPYVAYRDEANANKATVMRFDGTDWVEVGGAGFTAGEAWDAQLAFDSTGRLYIAFQDATQSSKLTVMKYGGGMNTNDVNLNTAAIYPNPADDYIMLSNVPAGSKVRISDMTGKTVYRSETANEQIKINVESFKSGAYIVEISNNQSTTYKKLLVK